MSVWIYILQSLSSGRYYCGQTDDIEKRLDQHNDPENTFTQTTSRFKGPWRLIHKIECLNRTDVIRLEGQIIKGRIRRFPKLVKKNLPLRLIKGNLPVKLERAILPTLNGLSAKGIIYHFQR